MGSRAPLAASLLWLCLLACVGPSISCFSCLVPSSDGIRLCWGYVLPDSGVRSMDACYRALERIFGDQRVTDAGRVGAGYDRVLRGILQELLTPLIQKFDRKRNDASVYEVEFQRVAHGFVSQAAQLPRATGCVPPCGFQESGTVYSCITCQYESCGYPLDCPMRDVSVGQWNRTVLQCEVGFTLPLDTQISWKFTKELRTQDLAQFEELTCGTDPVYAMPSTRREQQGTYLCEMFTQEHSIARDYMYLTVLGESSVGKVEMQELFDMALHSQTPTQDTSPPVLLPPLRPEDDLTPLNSLIQSISPGLLIACLSSLILLLLFSLG
ncbi:sperm acrosome membrane-associated protein 6 [Amia ocellicauda]|uniref:sperm acrosome membrane-associated protein 6 n=1 Tax=Amia ocellicauda TaxID=2972642 RepID=UPI003464694A